MYLTTSKKPKKTSLSLCKRATDWYAQQLLSSRLYNQISLKIIFDTKYLGKGELATCEWVDNNHKPRQFLFTIHNGLNKKKTLHLLAHECIHLKQFACGEMKEYLIEKKVRFRNKIYYDEQIDYWEQPWEIEAHAQEKVLYNQFISYLESKNE